MKWLPSLGVGAKMMGGLALTVITGFVIGLVGYVGLRAVENAKNEIVLNSAALRNHMEADMMHDALRADVLAGLIGSEQEDVQAMTAARTAVHDHAALFRRCIAANDALSLNNDIQQGIAGLKPSLESYIARAEQIVDSAQSNPQHAAEQLPGFLNTFSELEGKMSALSDLVEKNTLQSQAAGEESGKRANGWVTIVAAAGMLLTIGIARMILRSFIGPLRELGTLAHAVAQGDLTVSSDYESTDELGKLANSFNEMVNRLRMTLERVQDAANAVAGATSEISASTEEMAAGSTEQTTQTNAVAGAVEEMTSTILENSQNAGKVAATAALAKDSAELGGRAVAATIEGMKRIAEVVNISAATVNELGRSSGSIGAIVSVIDEIADQTNLLAFNAAIEAARAGEQGRGFAVVADEVRKLAERTSKATREIAEMIKQIQTDTAEAVDSIQQGTKHVDQGIRLTDQAGQSLKEIVAVSQQLTEMISQIAAASIQQSGASQQIARNVEAISSVTRDASGGTQQIARAADDLNHLSENLTQLIGGFTFTKENEDTALQPGRAKFVHRTMTKPERLFASHGHPALVRQN